MGMVGAELLQFFVGAEGSALHTVDALREAIKEGDLFGAAGIGFEETDGMDALEANERPFGDNHALNQETLGEIARLAGIVEVGVELLKILQIIAAGHDGSGAETVTPGIEARGRLASSGLGASGPGGIAAVRGEFFG
jgi:hypothetical protein